MFVSLLLAACGAAGSGGGEASADISLGETVYVENCASCHGENLEGQPNWQEKTAEGLFPAPPHDETGHTWHHSDVYIIQRIKLGVEALPPDMRDESNMPAYADTLTDEEIRAVLAYIKSQWPEDIKEAQQERTEADSGGSQ